MDERTSRPPRGRPGRIGWVMPEVEAGRCYLCGTPATDECRQCHRPVCDEHQVLLAVELQAIFGQDACVKCARTSAEDLARDEEQWTRKRDQDWEQRTCAVCSREFEQALPRCSQCGQHLCPEHRVCYRRRFRFGARGRREEAWYWDHEVRCHEHTIRSLVARLKGWEVES